VLKIFCWYKFIIDSAYHSQNSFFLQNTGYSFVSLEHSHTLQNWCTEYQQFY